MSLSVLNFGAINNLFEYIDPKTAQKLPKFSLRCPSCKDPVFLKKGPLNIPHFAHYRQENPCTLYSDHPSVGDKHICVQEFLRQKLQSQKIGDILRICKGCGISNKVASMQTLYCDPSRWKVETEKVFSFGIPDVVCMDQDLPICIFEVYDTHRTEDRPYLWFEIDVKDFIENSLFKIQTDKSTEEMLNLKCIRNILCSECDEKESHLKPILDQLYKKPKCLHCCTYGISFNSKGSKYDPKLCFNCTCCSNQLIRNIGEPVCSECLFLNEICSDLKKLLQKLITVNQLCRNQKPKLKQRTLEKDYGLAYGLIDINYWHKNLFTRIDLSLDKDIKDMQMNLLNES